MGEVVVAVLRPPVNTPGTLPDPQPAVGPSQGRCTTRHERGIQPHNRLYTAQLPGSRPSSRVNHLKMKS